MIQEIRLEHSSVLNIMTEKINIKVSLFDFLLNATLLKYVQFQKTNVKIYSDK